MTEEARGLQSGRVDPPKMAHKKMVQRCLQIRAHLILCFRARKRSTWCATRRRQDEDRAESRAQALMLDPDLREDVAIRAHFQLLLTADAAGVPKR